jgi:hypothetical protein
VERTTIRRSFQRRVDFKAREMVTFSRTEKQASGITEKKFSPPKKMMMMMMMMTRYW